MLWKVQKFWDNAWLTAGMKEAGAACASTLANSLLLGWSLGWDCVRSHQQQVAGQVESRLTPIPGAGSSGSAGASPAARCCRESWHGRRRELRLRVVQK